MSTATWITLLDALNDGYDKATEAIDWLSWGQDATMAIQQGKALPPSPSSPSMFQDRLEAEQTRISELITPSFDAPLPNTGPVPTLSFDATRGELRSRVDALQLCVSELANSKSVSRYFKQLDQALEMQYTMLGQLKDVLWKLAETYSVPFLSEQLFFGAVDVDHAYMPTVQLTREVLEAKRSSANSALAARLLALETAATEVKNVLVVEAIDLKVQVHRLQDLDQEVVVSQERFVHAVDARDRALADDKRCKVLLDASTLDVSETEVRLDAAQHEVARLKGLIDHLTSAINVEYRCPVSGANWTDCQEPSHAQYKTNYNNHRNELNTQLGQARTVHDKAVTLVNDTAEDLDNAKDQEKAFAHQFATAQAGVKEAETRLTTAKAELAEKARIAQEERWKSRTDLFFAENAKDQQQVTTIIGQIGTTP